MSSSDDNLLDVIDAAEDLRLKSRAVDATPFGITIADMRMDDDPIIYANGGFSRITGYEEDDILGRNCRFLQGEKTEDNPVRLMREAIDNGESVQVSLRNYRKNGSLFWSEVTLSPLQNDDGEITHYLGFQQDVSRRKEYEQQLESQRDDLTVLNEMVRHDIRNELQVALASMEVLNTRAEDRDKEQIATAIESINQAIELTNTARDVADVLLDSGADYRPVDVGSVVEEQIRDCQSSYPDAELSIEGTLPQVQVRANELLGSVFRNLLTNAIQHSNVETPHVAVTGSIHDDDVFVTVTDNGPGITDDQQGHLFEKGWSGANSAGTGIGLYVAHQLVDNYGGTLSLVDDSIAHLLPQSDLDGAQFVVRLPILE